MSLVTICRFLRTPAVSITISDLPSFSKRTSILSRVVPGTSDTITRSPRPSYNCAMELTSVLLPAFRLPTIATIIWGGGISVGAFAQIDVFLNRLTNQIDIAIVERGDADRRAESQPGEIAEHGVGVGTVSFIGHQHRLDTSPSQQRRDLFIGAGQPGMAIDQEQHKARLRHRQIDLMLNVFRERIGINKSITAGIHQLDVSVADLQWRGNAIARDAGHILHDADSLAGQRVEQRALADIWPTHNRDHGE